MKTEPPRVDSRRNTSKACRRQASRAARGGLPVALCLAVACAAIGSESGDDATGSVVEAPRENGSAAPEQTASDPPSSDQPGSGQEGTQLAPASEGASLSTPDAGTAVLPGDEAVPAPDGEDASEQTPAEQDGEGTGQPGEESGAAPDAQDGSTSSDDTQAGETDEAGQDAGTADPEEPTIDAGSGSGGGGETGDDPDQGSISGDGAGAGLDPLLTPAEAGGTPCTSVRALVDCGQGEVCRFFDSGEGRCESTGPRLAGQTCGSGSDCDDLSVCYGGRCSRMCAVGYGECVCPYGQMTCSLSGDGQFAPCLPVGYLPLHAEGFERGVCSP